MKKRRRSEVRHVVLGKQSIVVVPLKAEVGLHVWTLLMPWIEEIRHLNSKLSWVDYFVEISRIAEREPGTFVKLLGLLVGRTPEWIAENATAQEIVEAIPTVASVQKFGDLVRASIRLWEFIKENRLDG